MTEKWTRGCWHAHNAPIGDQTMFANEIRDDENGLTLAKVDDIDNAHLIAAAPELYYALLGAVDRVGLANAEGDPILSAWLPVAQKVLAKARGEG